MKLMKIIVTPKVHHKENQNYPCALVEFEKEDSHFFESDSNWMPKDKEVFALYKIMWALSPTFRELMQKELRSLNK